MAPVVKDIVTLIDYVVDIMDANGIDYWLDYGTLLGAVRTGGFIPGDSDADLSIYEEDAEKLFSLLQASPYVVHRGFSGSGLQLFLENTHIDIFFWYRDGIMLRRHYYVPRVDDRKGKDFPAIWVSYFTPVMFEGKEYNAPRCPERFCRHRYGATWRTPRRK